MMTINQSALATAVINITGNTQGLDRALGETKKQMHGFLVFAQAMGGRTGGLLANMLAMGGAKPALGALLGSRIGGGISGFLDRSGLMMNPVEDIDKAMEKARRDHWRNMYRHKMTGAGLQIGGMYDGQPINTPVDLASARAKHSLDTPKLADSMANFVPAAAKPAQEMAMLFGKLGAAVVVAVPAFVKLATAGEDLQRNLRRMSRTFSGASAIAMTGYDHGGSIMTKSQFAAGAAGFGATLAQNGVGGFNSARMSSNLAARSGAIAASWGDDFDQVAKKVQDALGGSESALAEYGVVLSDDLVRAKAFNDGMIKFGETMTASVAAQARYELIMNQTNKSVETAWQSFFNLGGQWATLMSTFKSAIASIGSIVVPATSGLIAFVNALLRVPKSAVGYMANLNGGPEEMWEKARLMAGLPPSGQGEDTMGRAKEDAARADDIIGRERARQSSNVGFHSPQDFYNHIQKGIFGDPVAFQRRQADLTHELLIVSKEQLDVLRDFGYKVKDGTALLQP